MIGAISCGRRKVWRTERRPSAQMTRRFSSRRSITVAGRVGTARRRAARSRPSPRPRLVVALEVVAGLLHEHVVERGLDQVEPLDDDAGLVERPDDLRDVGRAADRAPPARARPCAAGPCRSWSRPARPARRCRPARPISRWALPISAFSEPGVPSATMCPESMIPTRFASWSASSRYCVVRNTVVPSAFSFATSSQIALRLTGSRPVVGSSRKSTSGSWTSAEARSRRRRIPPE